MKKILFYLLIAGTTLLSCNKFDDSSLWDSIHNLNTRVEKLETLCDKMNTNIASLQIIVDALEKNDGIKSVSTLSDGTGYIITFVSGKYINIYHGINGENGSDGKDGTNGIDGKDGMTPKISVKKDTDGIYYWTVDGQWLIVNGDKIKASAIDGTNGNDGHNGQDGIDGKDGITPKFKIEEGYWYISYDNGASYEKLSKASGDNGLNGANGDNFFKGVSIEDGYVCFILNDTDSNIIKLPFISENELYINVETAGTLKSLISDGQERTILKLTINGHLNNDDIRFLRFYMTNLEYLDLSSTDITEVAEKAFEGMSRLKVIILPDTCLAINNNAFTNCRILEKIIAPKATLTKTSISSCVNLLYLECRQVAAITNLSLELVILNKNDNGTIVLSSIPTKKLVLSGNATSIGGGTSSATEVYFDPLSQVTNIPNGVFSHSETLKKITLPVTLQTFGDAAFRDCANLSEVVFPSNCMISELSLKSENQYSVFSNTAIKKVCLPSSITKIYGNIFYWSPLETLVFSESDNYCELSSGNYQYYSINTYQYRTVGALENTTNLKEIICDRKYPPFCTSTAFKGLDDSFFYECVLYVPQESLADYKSDTYWGKFKRILTVDEYEQ